MTVSSTFSASQINGHFDDLRSNLQAAIDAHGQLSGSADINGRFADWHYLDREGISNSSNLGLRTLYWTQADDHEVLALVMEGKSASGTNTTYARLECVDDDDNVIPGMLWDIALSGTNHEDVEDMLQLTDEIGTSWTTSRVEWKTATDEQHGRPHLLSGFTYRLSLVPSASMTRLLAVLVTQRKARRS